MFNKNDDVLIIDYVLESTSSLGVLLFDNIFCLNIFIDLSFTICIYVNFSLSSLLLRMVWLIVNGDILFGLKKGRDKSLLCFDSIFVAIFKKYKVIQMFTWFFWVSN